MINEMDIRYQKAMERKEGFELGEIKGREEGREERNIEIATNFKKLGASVEMIAQATGLTIEDISAL